MRLCRYCNGELPLWYAKNVWYHHEKDKDCRRLSKIQKSAFYYDSLKGNNNQVNDEIIIAKLASQIGLNVFIDWQIPNSMGFTWNSYIKSEKQEGNTIFHLLSYNYELFTNDKIKIYSK